MTNSDSDATISYESYQNFWKTYSSESDMENLCQHSIREVSNQSHKITQFIIFFLLFPLHLVFFTIINVHIYLLFKFTQFFVICSALYVIRNGLNTILWEILWSVNIQHNIPCTRWTHRNQELHFIYIISGLFFGVNSFLCHKM